MAIVITEPVLQGLQIGFSSLFWRAYQATPTYWQLVATEAQSSGDSEAYGWPLKHGRMREWPDNTSRLIENMTEAVSVLKNKTFEKTIAVPVNVIQDDKIGTMSMAFEHLGYSAAMWPENLVVDALLAGETSVIYDGQNFFDTDHPQRLKDSSSPTYSNLFTTTPLTRDNYILVRAEMMSYKGDDGEPLAVRPNLLVVPPQLEVEALEIVNAQLTENGGSNVLTSQNVRVLSWPQLANNPDDWYLMDTTRPLKPLLMQVRERPLFSEVNDSGDIHVFIKNQYVYGVKARGVCGYGLPWLAAKAKG